MPHQILKSVLPTEEAVDSFQRLVNEFIHEREKYDAHMKQVARDPKKFQEYPAPVGHPDIVSSVIMEDDGQYNISFEIIDDLTPPPPPAQPFEVKKHELVNKARMAFHEFVAPLQPSPLKQSLYNLNMSKLYNKEQGERSEEELLAIAEHERKQKLFMSASEKLAHAESDIDDLTEETIDNYQLPMFSEEAK